MVLAKDAPLKVQARAIINRVLNHRSGPGITAAAEHALLEQLQQMIETAHKAGFTEARSSCTLCSIVRAGNKTVTDSSENDAEL